MSLILYYIVLAISAIIELTDAEEYCIHDEFKPSCLDNQVIVTTSAKYGRMLLGRCIQTDFGYLGCTVDVLDDVHSRCSGRTSCLIRVPDSEFDEMNPCHVDLNNYLDVEYTCVNVTMPEWDTCYSNTTNNVTTSGYIASIVTMETGCGNEFSPWKLLALPGQRFNITLLDFKRKTLYSNNREKSTEVKREGAMGAIETSEQILCKELAIVEEEDIKTPLSSCEGNGVIDPGGTRYTSMGHNVTLYLRSRALDDDAQFVIKYEIVGCPDIEPNKFTWVTRDGDKVSVGCIATDLTWHMTCLGVDWQGEAGNCSAGEMKEARKDGDGMSLTIGSSVVIILVVSGVVGILVLLVGLFCMKRYRTRRSLRGDVPMKDIRPLNQDDNYDQDVLYARNNAFMPSRIRFGKQKLAKHSKTKSGDEDHDYEYVWDMSGVSKSGQGPAGNTIQTSACVVTARNTPKSPRTTHESQDACHCPEIHVHVHHTTENRAEGGQAQVSRVHIQARADTMPRVGSRTPGSSRRDADDTVRTPGTLRAIQPPPETPSRNRKSGESGEPSHKHSCTTMDRRSKPRESDHGHHHHHHCNSKSDPDGPSKRYWTLPVKSAFKAKQHHKQQQKLPSPKDSTG